MQKLAGQLIRLYIKLREEKKDLEDKHRQELAPLNEKMRKIEAGLHKIMNDNDLTQLKTKGGTAYVNRGYSVSVQNKQEFLDWVKDNEEWDALDVRANKPAVVEKGGVPGVKINSFYKTNIRVS